MTSAPIAFALIHAGLGEKEAAIDQLEQAYRDDAFELTQLNVIPAFDPLRTDIPRVSCLF